MKSLSVMRAGIALVALCAASGAMAQDFDMTLADGGVTVSGGVGVIGLEGREYVFSATGSTDVMSLLIWQSVAPVLTTGLEVGLPDGWTITGKAQVAIGGDSYMEDYDWIDTAPGFTDYQSDNWTDRSQHPDTNLDWYFNGSIAFGRDFYPSDYAIVNLHGGFKYTDVQWAAYGGSYVYTDLALRDTVGNFADGEPGITYRQQFPAAFVGLDTEVEYDQWTFGFGAQAGVIFGARAVDNHWMRDLLFNDTLYLAPTAAASASAEYAVTDQINVFLAGSVEKVFLARGDDAWSGSDTGSCTDCIGAELLSGTVTAGVKGSF